MAVGPHVRKDRSRRDESIVAQGVETAHSHRGRHGHRRSPNRLAVARALGGRGTRGSYGSRPPGVHYFTSHEKVVACRVREYIFGAGRLSSTSRRRRNGATHLHSHIQLWRRQRGCPDSRAFTRRCLSRTVSHTTPAKYTFVPATRRYTPVTLRPAEERFDLVLIAEPSLVELPFRSLSGMRTETQLAPLWSKFPKQLLRSRRVRRAAIANALSGRERLLVLADSPPKVTRARTWQPYLVVPRCGP